MFTKGQREKSPEYTLAFSLGKAAEVSSWWSNTTTRPNVSQESPCSFTMPTAQRLRWHPLIVHSHDNWSFNLTRCSRSLRRRPFDANHRNWPVGAPAGNERHRAVPWLNLHRPQRVRSTRSPEDLAAGRRHWKRGTDHETGAGHRTYSRLVVADWRSISLRVREGQRLFVVDVFDVSKNGDTLRKCPFPISSQRDIVSRRALGRVQLDWSRECVHLCATVPGDEHEVSDFQDRNDATSPSGVVTRWNGAVLSSRSWWCGGCESPDVVADVHVQQSHASHQGVPWSRSWNRSHLWFTAWPANRRRRGRRLDGTHQQRAAWGQDRDELVRGTEAARADEVAWLTIRRIVSPRWRPKSRNWTPWWAWRCVCSRSRNRFPRSWTAMAPQRPRT